MLLDLPYHKLETVLLFGNVQVTTQAMGELLEKGVALSMFSRQGMYRGSLEPPRGKNIELRIAQFEWFRDHERALATARAIVAAKIANGAAVLDVLRGHHGAAADFAERRRSLDDSAAACATAADIAALDGVEGSAARAYFGLAMEFNKSEMTWPGRVKHPATDPLNALLSLTYTLLMNEATALLEGAGLDPYLGFLHQVDYGRPSLALDLIEPFRHPVADRLVLKLVNLRVLEAADFQSGGEGHGMFLSPKPMKRYFEEYERWMLHLPAEGPSGELATDAGAKADGADRAEEPVRPGFREALRTEVEKLCTALRRGEPFVPWRFGAALTGAAETDKGAGGEGTCNTSSVTT